MLTNKNPVCPGIPITVALVGNPNCGKTTLFNALTGTCQQIGNWSGVTVERKTGYFRIDSSTVDIIDLPGTYSLTTLDPQGVQDTQITSRFLKTQSFSLVLNVVDALHCERNLYLTLQCLEQGLPLIIALNRIDLLEGRGEKINVEILSKALGVSVVPMVARQGSGIDQLKTVIVTAPTAPALHIPYAPIIEAQLHELAQTYFKETGKTAMRYQLLRWLEGEACELEFSSYVERAQKTIFATTGQEADVLIATARYDWIEQLMKRCKQLPEKKADQFSPSIGSKLDKILCHRTLGLPIFLLVMYGLFSFAITVGGFFQKYFEATTSAIFIDGFSQLLIGLDAPAWLMAIAISGIGKGISTVLTFIPVIGAMFLALAFLEDCGYMARAVFVVDRLMRAIGLPGKSLVPMIVGFGCNVPAIMGMRTLDNKRDRILAVMMSPFMSCGARLAIFTVFVAAFFPTNGQNIVFLLYLIGISMAILTGVLLKKTLLRGEVSPLLLEMPDYQWPHWRSLWLHAWHRLRKFVINAGKLIVPVCILVGTLNSITVNGEWVEDQQQTSLLAEAGKKMVPLFAPMGVEEENWPAVVGLLTGILAKEVVIGTLNSLYEPQGNPSQDSHTYGEMVKRFQGQPNAFAYLLFVLLYFPCVSATAAMVREVQRKWTIFSVCWTTGLAYAVAVIYYQCATFVMHPWISGEWIVGLIGTGLLGLLGLRHYGRVYLPRNVPTPITLT